MQVAEKHSVKLNFFVDMAYIVNLYKRRTIEDLDKDYKKVCSQLRDLHKNGHSLQLHIHPQWFYSQYDQTSRKWNMDLAHYKLQDCPVQDVEKMIKDGTNLLNSITGEEVHTFRAGGYSFPKGKRYIELLKRYGITTDSSVFMGKKEHSEFQSYDYRGIGTYDSYPFLDDIRTARKDGDFREFPISTIVVHPWLYLLRRIIYAQKFGDIAHIMGDGIGIGSKMSKKHKLKDIVDKFFVPVCVPASVDTYKSLYLKKVKKAINAAGGDTMVIIGHPKNCSKLGINSLDNFLSSIDEGDQVITFK